MSSFRDKLSAAFNRTVLGPTRAATLGGVAGLVGAVAIALPVIPAFGLVVAGSAAAGLAASKLLPKNKWLNSNHVINAAAKKAAPGRAPKI